MVGWKRKFILKQNIALPHCCRPQLTKLKTEINCWKEVRNFLQGPFFFPTLSRAWVARCSHEENRTKRIASKHGPPSESCPCIQYPLFGVGGDKADHPSKLLKGNVRVTCQLLMSPNERTCTFLHRHWWFVNWLGIIYICCAEGEG